MRLLIRWCARYQFLSSGMFKGVGPKIAARIVAALGPKAVEMFDSGDFEVCACLVCTYIVSRGRLYVGPISREEQARAVLWQNLRLAAALFCVACTQPLRGVKGVPARVVEDVQSHWTVAKGLRYAVYRVTVPLSSGSYLARPRPRPSTLSHFRPCC